VAQCGCNNEEQIYLAAIKDADEAVSRFGIAQLGNIGSKSALTELWNMLKIDFVGSFKDVEAQEACKAIGKIGDKASIPILTNLITNKKIILLSKFKKFDYLGLKLKAIWALGIIGDESTRSLLKKLFEDKDPKIKREAELALQKLDEKKMGLVDESSGRRKKKDVDPDSLSDKKITFDMFEEEDGEGKGHGKRDEDQVKTRIARRDEE
jgi:HEAT repeat protein